MRSAALSFVFFVFLYSLRGQVSLSALTPSRLSIGWGMETRGRAKLRATSSPPRAETAGGTQPVRDVFVDPPSSAIGLSGDGKVSSRSTSLEAGPRRTCHLTASSESAGGTHGPAQRAENEENREFVDTECSDIVRTSTPDERRNSTLVPSVESGTRGAASADLDLLRPASSVER